MAIFIPITNINKNSMFKQNLYIKYLVQFQQKNKNNNKEIKILIDLS